LCKSNAVVALGMLVGMGEKKHEEGCVDPDVPLLE
jgi:hypothetical protein